jgi:hypothetical protein
MHMNFGGPDGAQLPELVRIVAHHDSLRACLRGFAFLYSGGGTLTFSTMNANSDNRSCTTCVEQTAAINGPMGERIAAAEYGVSDVGGNVQSVKVSHVLPGRKCSRFHVARTITLTSPTVDYQLEQAYRVSRLSWLSR